MVAGQVEVFSRRAGTDAAARWSSDGLGTYTIAPVDLTEAPVRGTRVVLHLLDDAKSYAERYTIERIVKAQSGHVPVPINLFEKPDAEGVTITDGAALWLKPKSEISDDDYADFYRSVAGQYDSPARTIHYRAEGRYEYSVLTFIPGSKPFDLFDSDRKGHIKLYVRRVFITDEEQILPRYLRFVKGLVDSSDLPLNMSREMIQDSPVLAAIQKGVTGRVLTELQKLADNDANDYAGVWENFGAVLKEGLYEDIERRDALLSLARFKSTTSNGNWRSLEDYVADIRDNQTAIYYGTGSDFDRLAASPQIEGFRARGIEVLLLPDQVDNFWTTMGIDHEGKPFRSVTQGAADLSLIPLAEGVEKPATDAGALDGFLAFAKETLGDAVSDVRASERLTPSAVCLVAPESGMDRQLEKLLASAGQLPQAAPPVLEINPGHALIQKLAATDDADSQKGDLAHLLLDQARIADGEQPANALAFAERMDRLMSHAVG